MRKSTVKSISTFISVTFLLTVFYSLKAFAQQKEFEGVLEYKIEIKSKLEGVNSQAIKNSFMLDDSMKVFIKNGNYFRSSATKEEIYIASKQKVFIRLKGIDTLYFLDYSSDTTAVSDLKLDAGSKTIAGFNCKSLIFKVGETKEQFFYAPELYINPEHDKNNKIGRYDIYAKNARSVWLQNLTETDSYQQAETCVKLSQTTIDDQIFKLPNLPERKFSLESFLVAPEFGRSSGWIKYLQTSINAEVAGKHLKIPKGQDAAMQTAIVIFMISDKGKVMFAKVLNKNEVHPKLAEEALRIVQASPNWKPATLFGRPIVYWYKQPITFQVSK